MQFGVKTLTDQNLFMEIKKKQMYSFLSQKIARSQLGVHYIFSAFAITNIITLNQPIESVATHMKKYNFTQMHHTFQLPIFLVIDLLYTYLHTYIHKAFN